MELWQAEDVKKALWALGLPPPPIPPATCNRKGSISHGAMQDCSHTGGLS